MTNTVTYFASSSLMTGPNKLEYLSMESRIVLSNGCEFPEPTLEERAPERRVMLLSLPQMLDHVIKACQGQTLAYFASLVLTTRPNKLKQYQPSLIFASKARSSPRY